MWEVWKLYSASNSKVHLVREMISAEVEEEIEEVW